MTLAQCTLAVQKCDTEDDCMCNVCISGGRAKSVVHPVGVLYIIESSGPCIGLAGDSGEQTHDQCGDGHRNGGPLSHETYQHACHQNKVCRCKEIHRIIYSFIHLFIYSFIYL